MSSNVGLTTPRGSYVQRNLAHLRPRDQGKPYSTDLDSFKHRQRQPDKEILEHDRKRDVEVKVFELRDRLEDEGVDEDEIDLQTEALRKKLLQESERGSGQNKKGLKMHQVHELAEAKLKQDDRFRSALGISRDYEEGSHWKKQEERLKANMEKDLAAEMSSSEVKREL
ncbi:Pre-mRNA-splicing factor CWC21 [Hyphodiscus hymeniophilus]|uniref:Pre-mRNA-splicing factor CWC21 n=1 Tax=Hyphodiscus hymeniophilus TaxID=353542 RepID=A0A9P7AWD1_9HELO|nr:Pre-mRNA-splicing factor CWC21 [Hyphodiscus hymeniophilus]